MRKVLRGVGRRLGGRVLRHQLRCCWCSGAAYNHLTVAELRQLTDGRVPLHRRLTLVIKERLDQAVESPTPLELGVSQTFEVEEVMWGLDGFAEIEIMVRGSLGSSLRSKLLAAFSRPFDADRDISEALDGELF